MSQSHLTATNQQPVLLQFNENNMGISKQAKAAIIESIGLANRYPDELQAALLTTVAEFVRLPENQVMLAGGSSQCLSASFAALFTRARMQDKAVQMVMPVPTFDSGPIAAEIHNVPMQAIPLLDNLEADLAALRAASDNFDGWSVVYLCNPNNPTGTVVDGGELERWIREDAEQGAGTFFMLDEAYWEYAVNPRFRSGLELVREGLPNVAVTRTFSKMHGLAGLRVGYLMGQEDDVRLFRSFLSDLPVNALGLAAARASLLDEDFQRESLEHNAESRQIVVDTLKRLGLRYAESNANFVFHELPGNVGNNRNFRRKMRELNVYVGRDFSPYTGWTRLSLGTPEEMRHVMELLEDMADAVAPDSGADDD